MEAVTKLLELLKDLGPTGLWIGLGILVCLTLIYLAKQLQELRSGSLSVKEKQFGQLAKLLQEKDIHEKPGLLLEQAFENYFGFILGVDEIRHILKSKKQTEAIRDLKYCRGMFKFHDDRYVYIRKLKLSTRIKVNNLAYWVSALMTMLVTIYALTPNNWPLFIFTGIFGFTAYLSLDTSRALHSALRVEDRYYGPDDQPVISPDLSQQTA
ncbi:MAG: hypothetical protein ACYCZH_09405 [Sulfuriferula sp.]